MGMMGASLAAALRKQEGAPSVWGVVRSEASRHWILNHNLADEVLALSEFDPGRIDLHAFDLIILGMPIQANGQVMTAIYAHYFGDSRPASPSTAPENEVFAGHFDTDQVAPSKTTGPRADFPLITDMSSTRTFLEQVASRCPGLPFIGSHPMCGSEDAGPSAYRDNLFADRLVILVESTLRQNESAESYGKLEEFWSSVGALTSRLTEKDHDLVLAYLSHAPHLISSLLATITAHRPEVRRINAQSPVPITGGGLRDMLRIAGSNPEMWRDILKTNRAFILESLRDLRHGLDELIETVDSNSMDWWTDWQNQSRQYRNEICGLDD